MTATSEMAIEDKIKEFWKALCDLKAVIREAQQVLRNLEDVLDEPLMVCPLRKLRGVLRHMS